MRSHRAVAALLLLLAPVLAVAQSGKEPRRPRLAAAADTNDPRAYYDFAVDQLGNDPQKAADALYWASRIDPTWADPYFARRVALLLVDPTRFMRYTAGDRRALQDARAIDSLAYHAKTIDPFVSQRLDRRLFDGLLDELALRVAGGRVNSGNVKFAMEQAMEKLPPAQRARLAFDDGKLNQALGLYTLAIAHDEKSVSLRIERAHVSFELNDFPAALVDLNGAMDEFRKRDSVDIIFLYQSKALTLHSIAVVEERLGDIAAAKDALGRALVEDLSYGPAHRELAKLSLATDDTAGALREMDLATQLWPSDASWQFDDAVLLLRAGRTAEARAHLDKSIALDPYFASPRFVSARLLEAADFREEALAAYTQFLTVASRTDPRRTQAEQRMAVLKSTP